MDYSEPGGYWSHSLGRDLDACDRRVFYRVWGSFGGWSRDSASLPHLLYTARHSKDLKAYAGTVVHEAIQRLVERVRAGIRIPPRSMWLDRFDEKIRAEVRYSASRQWTAFANPKRAPLILYEHLVGADLHDWQIDDAVDRSQRAFSSFLDHYLPQIVEVGPERIVLIDSLDKVELDGFDLFLSPDLVLLEGYSTEIIDWKTGIGTNAEQLHAYAWYFERYRQKMGIHEMPVEGRSIPLLAPEKELRIPIGPDELASAEARIRRDLGRMRALSERAAGGDLAFSKTADPSACEWCSFSFHCLLRPDSDQSVGIASAVSVGAELGWFTAVALPADGYYIVAAPTKAAESLDPPWSAVVRVEAGEVWWSDGSSSKAIDYPVSKLCSGNHLWRRLGGLDWMASPPRLVPV